ncbi:acyltransferase domain-containing protein [Pseudomonas typographi]|uniref:Acyltransferase domain-containing protein n=1 Tax=Pseudomonas typographi TaxID=2715964 RepID=A0ABR7YZ74_9PSED|nr:acyltransferase domain-containing protein [Pseudomonas typographi]MBD1550057.1 acyltransferase domain-containing protein [Pseudomonas typographi]MBD1585439.1 acyltransferase domain-containing protein [Pseudomonas typographi]MBD1598448.1 acyltransferase domain-containing protein [Pseudomonas typographi]
MLAILCPGQGAQHPGMFDLSGQAPAAQPLFQTAGELLGEDPRTYVQHAGEQMFDNRAAQILCVAQALAAYLAIGPLLPRRLIVAGYSVGELSAWGIAGLLTPEGTLRVAKARGDLMSQGSGPDDGLAFIRGLPLEAVQRLASDHGVDVAIINPDDVTVVGGQRNALQAICSAALAAGALRADPLAVRVASHTSCLAKVVPEFFAALQAAAPVPPPANIVLLSALNAQPVFSVPQASQALADEIGHTLHWKDCLQCAYERGARVFLELGPGRALANMVTRAYPDTAARSLDEFRSLEGVEQWLSKHIEDA